MVNAALLNRLLVLRRGWLLLVFLTLPAVAWWQSIGDWRVYVEFRVPPGQILYVFSKLVGLYALFLAWLHIVAALLRQAGWALVTSWWSVSFHRRFGTLVAVCIVLHVALFVAAASLRTDRPALALLWPNFENFYAMAVSLGVLGLYGTTCVVAGGFARLARRRLAALGHYLALPVFAAAYTHGLLIGTETRSFVFLLLYGMMSVSLLAVGIIWVVKHVTESRKRRRGCTLA